MPPGEWYNGEEPGYSWLLVYYLKLDLRISTSDLIAIVL